MNSGDDRNKAFHSCGELAWVSAVLVCPASAGAMAL
jgi:hypothetical protein